LTIVSSSLLILFGHHNDEGKQGCKKVWIGQQQEDDISSTLQQDVGNGLLISEKPK
jgi:hypothetical protein